LIIGEHPLDAGREVQAFCSDALRGDSIQRVDDIATGHRWPQVRPGRGPRGHSLSGGVELHADGRSIDGQNVYLRRSHAFDEETRHTAALFATHALAMGRTAKLEQLNEALSPARSSGRPSAS
jgi:hypothetical protein